MSVLFNFGAVWGVGGQRHAPAVLPPEKTRCPFYRRLVGPQGRSGLWGISRPPPCFDPRTVHPVASRYTAFQPKWKCIACGVCLAPSRNTSTLYPLPACPLCCKSRDGCLREEITDRKIYSYFWACKI